MGSITVKDVQVNERGTNPIRELIRSLNIELRSLAATVSNNFREPIAIPCQLAASGTIWNPREKFSLLSLDVYCQNSGFTINAIQDTTAAIPVTGLPGTIVVAANTHTNIPCTNPYALDAGQNVYIGFSVAPTAEQVAVSLNVRRLG